jgi:hypothetical protein
MHQILRISVVLRSVLLRPAAKIIGEDDLRHGGRRTRTAEKKLRNVCPGGARGRRPIHASTIY